MSETLYRRTGPEDLDEHIKNRSSEKKKENRTSAVAGSENLLLPPSKSRTICQTSEALWRDERERVFHHEISHFSFLSVDDDDDDDPIVCVDHRHKS